ncbi:MAG: phosphatidate cytidylyltransferase [Bacteroidetes bacterium]|nr:phosphatidate cytidylyltransferase [Bacteroidota bacterium]
MKNLALRIITGLLGAGVIIGSIFLDAWAFVIVFGLIGTATHVEYMRTVSNLSTKKPIFEIVYAILVGLIFFIILNKYFFDARFINLLGGLNIAFLAGFIIAEIFYNRDNPFQHIGLNILGIIYIPMAFGHYINYGLEEDVINTWFAVGLLFMVWFNDSFAYFAGRLFGKTKLFERISPKKTWEGFWGGMLMTIVCSVILSVLYDDLTLFQWMGWAIIVSLSATLGDLAESLLKRSIHIKDSGSILPGHGGFLDRFDGFVIAVPFSIAYLWVLNFFNLV